MIMDTLTVWLILSKELREARRNRWFLLLASAFSGLALMLALLGMSALGTIGGAGLPQHLDTVDVDVFLGAFEVAPRAFSSLKTGDSFILNRIASEIATRPSEIRKGMR